MIQTSSATELNRYPKLFQIVAKELEPVSNPRILSFGCSSGEEVFSIKEYIPGAELSGVDINRRSISIAKKRDKAGAYRFFHFRDDAWKSEMGYDCILALAVFQKTDHWDSMRRESLDVFTFDKFQQMTGQLDSMLKPGGLFVIDHADFSFLDLSISKKFTPSVYDRPIRRARPLFSAQNTLSESSREFYRVFRKNSS